MATIIDAGDAKISIKTVNKNIPQQNPGGSGAPLLPTASAPRNLPFRVKSWSTLIMEALWKFEIINDFNPTSPEKLKG